MEGEDRTLLTVSALSIPRGGSLESGERIRDNRSDLGGERGLVLFDREHDCRYRILRAAGQE